MLDAALLGTAGLLIAASGSWLVRRLRRFGLRTRAGWGLITLGGAQVVHTGASLAGGRQPLAGSLAVAAGVMSVSGLLLAASALRRNTPAGRSPRRP